MRRDWFYVLRLRVTPKPELRGALMTGAYVHSVRQLAQNAHAGAADVLRAAYPVRDIDAYKAIVKALVALEEQVEADCREVLADIGCLIDGGEW